MPLALTTAALAYALFNQGGVYLRDWSIVTLVIAATALHTVRRPQPIPWPMIALPIYAAAQLIPLPPAILKAISPARAALHPGWNPLAVNPPVALEILLYILAATLTFLTIRHLAGEQGCGTSAVPPNAFPHPTTHTPQPAPLTFLTIRHLAGEQGCGTSAVPPNAFPHCETSAVRPGAFPQPTPHTPQPASPWLLAAPLIVLAALEAVLGLCQPSPAHGTYANRNHYAGLLEMALPFAVMYPIHVLRRARRRWRSPLRPALVACAGLSVAALILLGVIVSLSRMGFVAAVLALSVCALSGFRRLPLAAVIGLALLVYLPTDALLARFETAGASYENRAVVWRESLPLLAAYPVFGTGLGGFESAFTPYKFNAPLLTDDYVHNDYLQAAIETGIVGTLILAALFAGIVRQALRAAAGRDPLDVACLAALTAIGLHSIVDFNLYIPANALVLAWICGLVSPEFSAANAV